MEEIVNFTDQTLITKENESYGYKDKIYEIEKLNMVNAYFTSMTDEIKKKELKKIKKIQSLATKKY